MLLQGGRRRSAKQQAKATTTKKNMHKPIAFDVCSHNVSYTQCEQASQPRKWARFVHVLRIRHAAMGNALKWLWQIIFLVNAFNMVINQALTHTHTQGETLEEPQTLTAVEWRQASHLVIESGNLNESAGNAIDMIIVITIDIDNGNGNGIGKAIIVVVLPRHKPHRHCHYSAAFAITPLLAWMSVCGLRTARSESTSCRLALASEYLNLILTFIMHTQEAHISVPLSISACPSLSFPLWQQITCAIWFHFRSAAAVLLIIKLLDLFRFIFGFDLLADDEKCLQLIDWQLAAVEWA